MNWHNETKIEVIALILEETFAYSKLDLLAFELLELVEIYAESQGWIDSEQVMSEHFDAFILDFTGIQGYLQQGTVFVDPCMFNADFSQHLDALCKGDEIHPIQDSKYCYVGKYESELV